MAAQRVHITVVGMVVQRVLHLVEMKAGQEAVKMVALMVTQRACVLVDWTAGLMVD